MKTIESHRNRFEAHPKTAVTMILLLLLVVVFGGAELLTRVVARQFIPKDHRELYEENEHLGWTYRPSLATTIPNPYGDREISIRINSDGFREREFASLPQGDRILFVGDSGVGSVQVDEQERFTNRIEKESSGKWVGVNAGVNGYGTDQAVMVAEKYAPLLKPRVIVYFFSENDLEDNMSNVVNIWPYDYGKPSYDENMRYAPRPFAHRRMAGDVTYYYSITYLKEHFSLINMMVDFLKDHFKKDAKQLAGFSAAEAALIRRVPINSQIDGPKQKAQWLKLEKLLAHLEGVAKKNGAHLLIVPFVNYVQVNEEIMAVLSRYYANVGTKLDFNLNIKNLNALCARRHLDCADVDVEKVKQYQMRHGPLHFVKGTLIYDGHLTSAGHAFFSDLIRAKIAF